MKKRILINGITFENAVIIPLLTNIKHWQSQSCKITFIGNSDLKNKIKGAKIINHFNFIEIRNTNKITSKIGLILEGVKRNLIVLGYLKGIVGNYDILYTRSSVLDLLIFPYILKIFDKRIKWVSVFENVVPLSNPGSKFNQLLAWIFFQFSLILLKRADKICVILEDLENYLIKKGFSKSKLVLTGIGLEADLIKKSKRDKRFNFDALFIGRINENKGIYDMLEVLELVIKAQPGFQLAIMGDGDIQTIEKYKREIKRRELERHVQFLGFKAGIDKFKIIKSSKIFLFLSKSESFGIALLEAVCCGVRAFAYDLSPYRNIYLHNEISVFPIGNYNKVAQSIIKTFEKKDFNNKKGSLLLSKYNYNDIARIEYKSFWQ